jgi:hypothetical protein
MADSKLRLDGALLEEKEESEEFAVPICHDGRRSLGP